MPLQAIENRIEDAIGVELAKIGIAGGAGAWLTTPSFVAGQGIILDGIPPTPRQQLYLQYVSTIERPDLATSAGHAATATWHAWCVSTDQASPASNTRIVKNLAADVVRAIYAGEGAIRIAGADLGFWIGTATFNPDLVRGGATVITVELTADFHRDHASDP